MFTYAVYLQHLHKNTQLLMIYTYLVLTFEFAVMTSLQMSIIQNATLKSAL